MLDCIIKVFFNWVSKEIRGYFGFALHRPVIGLEDSRHALNQSDAGQKLIVTWSHAFPAFGSLLFYSKSSLANGDVNLCYDWLL